MAVGVNLDNFGAMQTNYDNTIVDALASGAKSFKIPEVVNWEGENIEFRVQVGKNGQMGFVGDGGAYSPAGQQQYTTAKVGRRFFQTKLQLTEGIMAAARTGANAFRSVMTSEVQGLTENVMDFYNKMFFLDGTGIVATLKGSPAYTDTSSIQVDNPAFIFRNAVLEVRDASVSYAQIGEIKVSAVEPFSSSWATAYPEFALDTSYGDGRLCTATGVVAGDALVWQGSYNKAISGLDALVDDAGTTFQNVNTSTYPEYLSYVNSNGGTSRLLTPQVLRLTLAGLYQRAGNNFSQKPLRCIGTPWAMKEFEEMYEGAYRLESGGSGEVGFKGTKFVSGLGTIEIDPDTDCPASKLFLVDTTQLKHAVQKPLGFNKDGGSMFRQSHNSLHATAVMSCISQMYIKDRKTSAKIEDLTTTRTVA